jgi:hypothetical protein
MVVTSTGGLLVLEDIVLPVSQCKALTWFIRYLRFYHYHWVVASTGGLLVLEDIVLPVSQCRALT